MTLWQASLFPAFGRKMPEIPEIRSQDMPILRISFQTAPGALNKGSFALETKKAIIKESESINSSYRRTHCLGYSRAVGGIANGQRSEIANDTQTALCVFPT